MTKKHFIAFAKQAALCREEAKEAEKLGAMHNYAAFTNMAQGIEQAVCNIAKDFNPNFNEEKFRAACRKEL